MSYRDRYAQHAIRPSHLIEDQEVDEESEAEDNDADENPARRGKNGRFIKGSGGGKKKGTGKRASSKKGGAKGGAKRGGAKKTTTSKKPGKLGKRLTKVEASLRGLLHNDAITRKVVSGLVRSSRSKNDSLYKATGGYKAPPGYRSKLG